MLLNNQWVNRKSKVTRDEWKWKSDDQIMGSSKRSSKREVYTGTILPQVRRKISN